MNTTIPRMPVSKLTPRTSPSANTGMVSMMIDTMSAAINPSSSIGRLIGVSSSRSK